MNDVPWIQQPRHIFFTLIFVFQFSSKIIIAQRHHRKDLESKQYKAMDLSISPEFEKSLYEFR